MKLMKYITGCSAALLLLAACSKEEGPSVDDYFLNYEIPEIPVLAAANIPPVQDSALERVHQTEW